MEISATTSLFAVANLIILICGLAVVIVLAVCFVRSNRRRKCSNCGRTIPTDAQVCPYCGYSASVKKSGDRLC